MMKPGIDNPLVAHLVAAHHTGHLVPYTAALVPHDIVAAYTTQSHVAETLGAEVSGWKAGYVTGDALRNFRALDLARLRCRVTVDGAVRHDRAGGHPQNDPFAPVIACLGQGLMGLGGFRAGQIITTGSLITPLKPTARM